MIPYMQCQIIIKHDSICFGLLHCIASNDASHDVLSSYAYRAVQDNSPQCSHKSISTSNSYSNVPIHLSDPYA